MDEVIVKRSLKKRTAKKTKRKSRQLSRANDAIRIVPLHLPSELYRPAPGIAPAAAAQLTYREGPLLEAVEVFTIFWGAAWQSGAQLELASQINEFFKFVVGSA